MKSLKPALTGAHVIERVAECFREMPSTLPRRDTARARVMRRLPAPLRGLVLDHLRFPDVLSATTTDSAGRRSLGSVRRLSGVNDRFMSSPHLLNKVPLCEAIEIKSKNALVFERLAWALQTLRHLREVHIMFAKGTDETAWRQSCTTLSNSPELGRLRLFRFGGFVTNGSRGCDEFKSLVLQGREAAV